jgi:hypothetical protein
MIKRFWLPNTSFTAQFLLVLWAEAPDAIHDFGQRINLHGLLVDERREDEVNVIRHHNSDKQVEFNSVVVKAALEHDRTDAFRKNPPVISTESDEMLPVIALKMRKLSTIKSLPHKV